MPVLRREWYGVTRPDRYTIIPLGDIHLGNSACDEALLQSVVKRIKDDPNCYWIGLGDYCEFIQRSDPRFSIESLADWLIKKPALADLAKAQSERLLEILKPIAGKCLAVLEGNHERTIAKYYERNIYNELVTGIKDAGEFKATHKLGLGYYGWLILRFRSEAKGEKHRKSQVIKLCLHHGFVGGKLAGAKALNMQRWLWSHDCDLAIFGHSHNAGTQVEAIEKVAGNKVIQVARIGCYGGSFMTNAQYATEKGYFPLPTSHIEVHLRPLAKEYRQRVQVVSGL